MEKIKIFFFPYAGGSARVYLGWQRYMPAGFEIVPIEMKGRGGRFSEKQCQSMEEMIEDAFQQIRPQIGDHPYAIYGHSMGAIVGHEVAYRIREAGLPGPMHLFLSGREAPHMPTEIAEEEQTYQLSDERFRERLQKIGGTPKEILENPEMMEIFIPILRQDFKNCALYKHQERDYKLECGLTAFGGMEEEHLTEEQLHGWQRYTDQKISVKIFPGDHFFIFQHTLQILRIVCRTLYEVQKRELTRSSA